MAAILLFVTLILFLLLSVPIGISQSGIGFPDRDPGL